jgi:hypothetical protein
VGKLDDVAPERTQQLVQERRPLGIVELHLSSRWTGRTSPL